MALARGRSARDSRSDRKGENAMDRRDFIQGATGLGLAATLGWAAPSARSLVGDENQKPGTTDWMLTNAKVDPATVYRCPWIEGYCSKTSVRAGETIDLRISTRPASRFTIDLY